MQGLLRELMKQVEKNEGQWKAAAEAYAATLSKRNMHEDAAVAFLAAKLPEQALASYRSAGQWHMAFALAGMLSLISHHLDDRESHLLSALSRRQHQSKV